MDSTTSARSGEWLEHWGPENEDTWNSSLAWRTLWITTFCHTLAFVAWFLPSAIIPKLNALGGRGVRARDRGTRRG
jgi:NNP family nitrate/nitrite transporter-like MFS transporter